MYLVVRHLVELVIDSLKALLGERLLWKYIAFKINLM